MLSFITYVDAPNQLEIIGDDQGIEDLIGYLKEVQMKKDHLHLAIGTELNSYPIEGNRKGKTLIAKQVRIEFAPTEAFNEVK